MAAVTICSDFGAQKIKSDTVSTVSPSISHEVMGKQWEQCQTLFLWAPKSLQMVIAAMKLRRLLLGGKVMTNLDSFD